MQANSPLDQRRRLCCLGYPGYPAEPGDARRSALQADLAQVRSLVERDPEAVAMLLDGLLQCIGAEPIDVVDDDVA